MILIVVRKVGWQKSPWDSWTRTFEDEAAFLEWWHSQSENSYARRVSREYDRVRVYRIEEDATNKILAPFALPWKEEE